MRKKTNKEDVFDLIQKHPEGLDDDDISAMTGITPIQQVQQLCNRLAASNRIRRESVEKPGKRLKIHNFPNQENSPASLSSREDSFGSTGTRSREKKAATKTAFAVAGNNAGYSPRLQGNLTSLSIRATLPFKLPCCSRSAPSASL